MQLKGVNMTDKKVCDHDWEYENNMKEEVSYFRKCKICGVNSCRDRNTDNWTEIKK
jgi:hypothetical protein